MKLGEVVSDEHTDQSVLVVDQAADAMSEAECGGPVQPDQTYSPEDELDLIVFRCRD